MANRIKKICANDYCKRIFYCTGKCIKDKTNEGFIHWCFCSKCLLFENKDSLTPSKEIRFFRKEYFESNLSLFQILERCYPDEIEDLKKEIIIIELTK